MNLRQFCHGLWVFVLVIFSWSSEAKLIDRVVAIVGNEPILHSDVTKLQAVLKKSPSFRQIYPVKNSREAILENLINEKIVHVSLKASGSSVSSADVEKQMNGIARQNGLSVSELKSTLKAEGIPLAIYENNIRSQIEQQKIFEREIRSSIGTPTDTELRLIYEKTAKNELNLYLWTSDQKTAANSHLKSVAKQKESKALQSFTSLGWVEYDSLNSFLKKSLKNKSSKKFIGPFSNKGTHYIFYIASQRQGSEDSFQKQRSQLIRQAQKGSFDNAFKNWLDKKKQNIEVSINR